MKFKLIYLALPFCFFSCKNENAFVEGRIFEEHYNLPMEGVTVQIRRLGNPILEDEGIEASVKSDNTGHFRLNYRRKLTWVYSLEFKSSKLFRGSNSAEIRSKKINKDFVFPSATPVKFSFKNNQTNEIQLNINSDVSIEHSFGNSIAANSELLHKPILNANGFGKTAFTYSITSSQNPLQIIHDTISIFTKTDTLIHLVEIN